jgi:hypothetical protein
LRRAVVLALILIAFLLAACGGQGDNVKLVNASFLTKACQAELIDHPMYWAIWTIKPSAAVTIDHVSLQPSQPHPAVRFITTNAQTRNAGGIGGEPWVNNQSPGAGVLP